MNNICLVRFALKVMRRTPSAVPDDFDAVAIDFRNRVALTAKCGDSAIHNLANLERLGFLLHRLIFRDGMIDTAAETANVNGRFNIAPDYLSAPVVCCDSHLSLPCPPWGDSAKLAKC